MQSSQIISSTYLVRNLSKCLDMAKNQALYVVRQSSPEVVILSIEEYERLVKLDKKRK